MFKIRQEPCVYVNGKPYSVRSTDDMTNPLMMTEVPNITITITITTAITITTTIITAISPNAMYGIIIISTRQATSQA